MDGRWSVVVMFGVALRGARSEEKAGLAARCG
jgi:hypothetical protein